MAAPDTAGWTEEAIHQAHVYCSMAQVSAGMNERAALYYARLDRAALIVVSVLTVISGSQGVTSILGGSGATATPQPAMATGPAIFLALCNIGLGCVAAVVSRLEWRSKATAHSRRTVGYAALAASIRNELCLAPPLRTPAKELLRTITDTFEKLETLTDPVPSKFRRSAGGDDGIMSMWGARNSFRVVSALPTSPEGATAVVLDEVGVEEQVASPDPAPALAPAPAPAPDAV